MHKYNLVDEQWIPCLMRDGSQGELSLLDTLTQAHLVREIHDSSPLVTVALHRLLLAILHRVFGPVDEAEWIELWARGRWDSDRVGKYLRSWRHRFDLFDEHQPFAQVPCMNGAHKHTIASLVLEAASGNNATLFNHAVVEGGRAITPGRAACRLLAHHAFAIGFGKSKPFYLRDGPLTRGMSFLAYGDNLFETLALNLMPDVRWRSLGHSSEDKPPWELEIPREPDPNGTLPSGRCDYLTWPSRRIHLIAEGEPPMVVGCQIQQGLCLPSEPRRWDPYKRYRRDERGWSAVGLAPDKAVWRDAHALLNLKLVDDSPPELLRWLGTFRQLRQDGDIQSQVICQLVVFGISTAVGKAASVEMWRQERLPLPLVYLDPDRDELLADLKACIDVAEDVGSALRKATWFVANRILTVKDGRGGPDVPRLAAHLSLDALYWPELEEPFRRLVEALPEGKGVATWRRELEQTARRAFGATWSELEGSGRGLHALVDGESYFGRLLNEALKPIRRETEG